MALEPALVLSHRVAVLFLPGHLVMATGDVATKKALFNADAQLAIFPTATTPLVNYPTRANRLDLLNVEPFDPTQTNDYCDDLFVIGATRRNHTTASLGADTAPTGKLTRGMSHAVGSDVANVSVQQQLLTGVGTVSYDSGTGVISGGDEVFTLTHDSLGALTFTGASSGVIFATTPAERLEELGVYLDTQGGRANWEIIRGLEMAFCDQDLDNDWTIGPVLNPSLTVAYMSGYGLRQLS